MLIYIGGTRGDALKVLDGCKVDIMLISDRELRSHAVGSDGIIYYLIKQCEIGNIKYLNNMQVHQVPTLQICFQYTIELSGKYLVEIVYASWC